MEEILGGVSSTLLLKARLALVLIIPRVIALCPGSGQEGLGFAVSRRGHLQDPADILHHLTSLLGFGRKESLPVRRGPFQLSTVEGAVGNSCFHMNCSLLSCALCHCCCYSSFSYLIAVSSKSFLSWDLHLLCL